MLRFVIRRVLQLVPVLFGLSIILFAFVHFLPGDPCRSILGQHATVQACNRLRENLGLDGKGVGARYRNLHRTGRC